MPPVWAEIEGCKTDRDLRTILQNHWGKNKKDLNTMFYDIYWGEELLKSIRIADFTRSNMATFLTSELGLSMILLMPRTEDEIIELDAEWERRRRVGKNVTTADYKAAEKAPRMPPLRWDEVCLLFTTWALMLKMLFGKRNAHLLGLNSIRQHMMTLSSTKHLYNAQYFANVVWCVLDDAVRSFNQVMPYDDLVTANELTILQFPTTRLHQVASMLSMQSNYSMATFPREWQMHADRRASVNQFPATVSFGGGSSLSGTSATSLSSGVSTITGNTGRSNNIPGDKGDTQNDAAKVFRETHTDRYGANAVNPSIQNDIKEVLTGMGDVNFAKVLDASNTSWFKLKESKQYNEGICPAFAMGKCRFNRCQARHLLGQETPHGWAKLLCTTIEPGCIRIKSGEDIPPRKKFRGARGQQKK